MRILSLVVLCALSFGAAAERIKDIAKISGVRSNHLIGYGLVVGLDGTGDNTSYTTQSFKTLLSRFGVQMPAGVKPESKNIAAVAIHADLPAFAKPGHKIDITVSSIGNAKSLRGGTLLMSYLKGIDNKVYAVAQGNLLVGGFGAEGKDGSQIKVNVPVVGRIAGGATIEVEAPSDFGNQTSVTFLLNRSDFTTSKRMADVINQFLGNNNALPEDSATVIVKAPPNKAERVRFLSALENLSLESGEAAAKIVVNSRTGTIVVGKNVRVGPAAVAHGSLSVTITERVQVSQPEANAGTAVAVGANASANANSGTTVASPASEVFVSQPNSRMFLINQVVELESIVRAINEVGAAPGDLMAILEALKQVGALEAEIEVI